MDVKVECERILMLCQGCLSADRKLSCITGHNKALFVKLREDAKQSDMKELFLCWECVGLLNKVKHFQTRIKTAQYRLVRYLHTLYNKKDTPHSLSQLIKTKHKEQFDYKYQFIYEEEHKDLIFEQNNLLLQQKDLLFEPKDLTQEQKGIIFEQKGLTVEQTEKIFEQKDLTFEQKDQIFEQKDLTVEQKDQIFEQKEETDTENLLLDIKLENNNIIKEEYDNISINNDTDYYDSELKQETDIDYTIIDSKKTKKKHIKQSIKKYAKFATVTQMNALFTKNISQYYETVLLNEREIEQVLNRDRRCRGNEGMTFKCKLCGLGYLRRLDFLRHKSFYHIKLHFPTNCKACKREIISQLHLEEHWKEYHTPMLRCSLCGELSRSKGEQKKHLNRMHTKTFACNSCPLEFRSLREFSNHYKISHERAVCDYCNKSMSTKQKLETHIIKMHLPQHCAICNRDYSSYHVFETHLRGSHPELLKCLKGRDSSEEMRYCVECDKQYPSIYKYKRHLKQSARHTPKEKIRVPCPACDKVFTRTSYKNNHYRLVHIKESKHYCELCNKYFATGYGVRKHIQYVHQKIAHPKDKICDLCGRGFSTNRILINHRRTHTGERPFKCQYCPASFAQETAMKTHQKTQHKNIMLSNENC